MFAYNSSRHLNWLMYWEKVVMFYLVVNHQIQGDIIAHDDEKSVGPYF